MELTSSYTTLSNITTPSSTNSKNNIPLTVFDKVTFDCQVACIIAYHPPTPPNASLEHGLCKALSIFRPYAGRPSVDKNGDPIIVLNDEGVKFIEASVDGPLDEWVPFEQSPNFLRLHPSTEDVDEVLLPLQ
ncbi:hypothetical protein LIER_41677 [Lithospermum erythrorhizon]|uniref:Uncharacterized protein n=1 Tax=Lithospermum erythrorhizon TaxID=34254 RepID=A0AAV3REI4_LITER